MKFKKSFCALCVFAAISVSSAFAQQINLSVDDAIKYAVEGNISLKQSKISLDSAKRTKNYSWNGLSPNLSASARLTGPMAVFGTDEKTTSFTAGGTVSLGLTPAIYTTIRSAAISYEQSLMSYENAVKTIELNVRKVYYSILFEQENVKLQEQSVSSSKQQYESNLARYNRGTLSKLDVLSAQVSYQNAALSLESLKSTLENDLASFKQILGIPQEKEIVLTGSFDFVQKIGDISLEGIQSKSATIANLEKQLEAAENALLATRLGAWGPQISASYSYNYSGTFYAPDKAEGSSTYSVGVSIPLDSYLPWSNGAQGIAARKDAVKNLNLQLEDAKTTVSVQTKNALKKIKQSQASLKLRQESINLAQQTFEMTQEAYNHGTKDLLSLQSASDKLLSAKISFMSEEFTLISAILDLENTIGVPFGTLIGE